MIRAILSMLFLLLLFILLFSNKDASIPIHYYPGGTEKPVALYLFALGTFLSGFILTLLFLLPGWFRLKLESRRQRREIESLSEEIGHLRMQPPASPTPAPPVSIQKHPPER
jgi:uncharacterized integral membrane protein